MFKCVMLDVITLGQNRQRDLYWAWCRDPSELQSAPLIGITDNGINQLIGSNLSDLTNPKLPLPT